MPDKRWGLLAYLCQSGLVFNLSLIISLTFCILIDYLPWICQELIEEFFAAPNFPNFLRDIAIWFINTRQEISNRLNKFQCIEGLLTHLACRSVQEKPIFKSNKPFTKPLNITMYPSEMNILVQAYI